jgi:hypothetical protein
MRAVLLCLAVAAFGGDAVGQLATLGARVVGVVSDNSVAGLTAEARLDLGDAVIGTRTWVTPAAWDSARPPPCAAGSCCTGNGEVGEAPDGSGRCPLVFRVPGNGSALTATIAAGVTLAIEKVPFAGVTAAITDAPGDLLDAVFAFVDRVEADTTSGAPCTAGLTAIDTNADTVKDTYTDVMPGQTVCFAVVPKTNTLVGAISTMQTYKAVLSITADGMLLATRDIYFVVPPLGW